MRATTKGNEPACLTQHRAAQHSFYHNYEGKDALRAALVAEQRGLCCYCMSRIVADSQKMKIEHWQSQSATREDSETGLRYRNHVRLGSSILLFARLRADDRAFWFLGPATYVKHESETPMSVTWRLDHPLPGDLFEQFAAAVA